MSQSDDRVNILLVDDRRENLLALQTILDSPAYRLVLATSGDEALTRVLEQDFAVVVLDVFMPNMDGFEVAAIMRQRERSRRTPIIFITAVGTDVQLAHRGYSVGAVDYLTKPIDPKLLGAKVAVLVDLFRKGEQIERQAEQLRRRERHEQELALAQLKLASERRYRFLTNAIPQIVWTARPDGTVDYCNQRCFEYTGLTPGEIERRGWVAAVPPEDAQRCQSEWQQAVMAGRPYESECRLRRAADGAHRWHLCRAVPEHDAAGRVVAWLGTHTDIDDQKRLQADAQRAIATRDELLAVVSHDLRNPLSAIKLTSALLLKGSPSNARRHAETIGRSADLMERLIRDLLDSASLDAGNLVVERSEHDVAAFIADVVETLRPLSEQRENRLEVQTTDERLVAVCDRDRVFQVLSNLVGNAIKFTPQAGVVRLRAVLIGREVCFSVADNGPGIPEDQVPHVFERYWKGPQSARGTGLGLYISQGLVRAHGGRIWLESKLGLGTTFFFTLPGGASLTSHPEKTTTSAETAC